MSQSLFSEPECLWKTPQVIQQSQRLLKSFQHWTGRSLLNRSDLPGSSGLAESARLEKMAQDLFEAPFVMVAHGTEPDPIFNYGNRQAPELWELDWQSFTQMLSRQSAAQGEQEARQKLLAAAKQKGYISDYRGMRTSSTGKQFWIENVILWNVLDEQHQPCGQAATFSQWQFTND
ncbi:MAG: MEKHLA domain-containing protein [Leptolyngbyaceae cyanobacterium CSU_1_4]|nr:MEKHLA domain-containing protein [Leptolyngbyaceae cyanobacterium CSU_1_4]